MWTRLAKNEGGATAIEYGLLTALISLAALIAFQMLGLNLVDVLMSASRAMDGVTGG